MNKRGEASLKALKRKPKNTVSKAALSRQTKDAAKRRGPADLSRAAKRAARTRKKRSS